MVCCMLGNDRQFHCNGHRHKRTGLFTGFMASLLNMNQSINHINQINQRKKMFVIERSSWFSKCVSWPSWSTRGSISRLQRCALDIYFGHASSFGTVAAPNISLSVVKLSAILQEYVSSTHSSTVLTGLDSTLPANANSRTFPPLLIVPRLNKALGDTRLPPL